MMCLRSNKGLQFSRSHYQTDLYRLPILSVFHISLHTKQCDELNGVRRKSHILLIKKHVVRICSIFVYMHKSNFSYMRMWMFKYEISIAKKTLEAFFCLRNRRKRNMRLSVAWRVFFLLHSNPMCRPIHILLGGAKVWFVCNGHVI